MQTNVFESMYAKLLNGALQAIDILSPAKSEQDLRVLLEACYQAGGKHVL